MIFFLPAYPAKIYKVWVHQTNTEFLRLATKSVSHNEQSGLQINEIQSTRIYVSHHQTYIADKKFIQLNMKNKNKTKNQTPLILEMDLSKQ